MRWNLIRQELRLNRRSWWIGAAVILLFQAMFAGLADTYTQNQQLLDTMKTLPQGLLEGFGIHAEMMSSFEGWMSGEPFIFYVLLLGAFAANWASTGVAKERDQQTAETLFSLPYSRSNVFLSKAAAHWLQITVIFILSFLIVYGLGLTASMTAPSAIILMSVGGYCVALAFAGMGYVITVLLRSERAALSLGIGLVLVSFLFKLVAGMSGELHRLADLSLFTAFDNLRIVTEHTLTGSGLIATLGIYACGLAIGGLLFKRQDI